jgi:hypothetical protein
MQNRCIILALFAFLITGAVSAQAETTPSQQKTIMPPANMNDAALASYISGKLTPLLKDSGYQISQSCDSSGCAVVVQ